MSTPSIVLSFDIEEHYRIEAAAGLNCSEASKRHYTDRMEVCTRWLIDSLGERGILASFYVVGRIARSHPGLIRRIAEAGHEVGTHSLDHLRVHRMNPESFREDIRESIDLLQQAGGVPVYGFRAPTFSVVRETAWAIDVLADLGLKYDSSVFPVRHDRYGVPDAPRTPFIVRGVERELLELPPATWRIAGQNLPVAGGGYFRLFPLKVLERGIAQLGAGGEPRVAMLYFHPWEFDPNQEVLPLETLSRWRTYVGIARSRARLKHLMRRYSFRRAIDVVDECERLRDRLPRFSLNPSG